MVDNKEAWLKIVLNAIVTGVITGLSTLVTTGKIDAGTSLLTALIVGVISFCTELKAYLKNGTEVVSARPVRKSVGHSRNFLLLF